MEITEVRVTLRNEEKLRGFANITLDNQIVIRGLKIIAGTNGYFVSMPSRKRPDGSHQDIAHPVNSETRKMVEDKVLHAYEEALKTSSGRITELPAGLTDHETADKSGKSDSTDSGEM